MSEQKINKNLTQLLEDGQDLIIGPLKSLDFQFTQKSENAMWKQDQMVIKAEVIYDFFIKWRGEIINWSKKIDELGFSSKFILQGLGKASIHGFWGEKKFTNINDPIQFCENLRIEAETKLKELFKIADERPHLLNSHNKESIYLSKQKGVCRKDCGDEKCYPIKAGRWKLLYSLRDGLKSGEFLSTTIWKHGRVTQVSKDIREVNKLFKKILNVKSNLIVRLETNGYRLNEEVFEIRWLD